MKREPSSRDILRRSPITGGGYLIFGVDDRTRKPQGATEFDRSLFGEDAMSSIITRYLDPPFQCQTMWVTCEGSEYPVVVVPAHGARPVIARADGPHDDKDRPVGVQQGVIYIRAPGPRSIAIRAPEDWTALLERCLSHRADLLANIMHRVLDRPSDPTSDVTEMLRAACNSTAADFIDQIRGTAVPADIEESFRRRADNFVVLGYALVSNEGELLPIEDPYSFNDVVSSALHRYYVRSHLPFRHVRFAERAPQIRSGELLTREASYLEGMRLAAAPMVPGSSDYWRVYGDGIVTNAESYIEDNIAFRIGLAPDFLLMRECLAKLHALLAHARLAGQEMLAVNQIVLRMDWRDSLVGTFVGRPRSLVTGKKLAEDRIVKTITLSWPDLRESYFSALRRVAVTFFGIFDCPGYPDAAAWLTQELAHDELRQINERMNMFED